MCMLQEDENCGALGVDLPWLAASRVCIVYIGVDVDTYDIDRLKSISMHCNGSQHSLCTGALGMDLPWLATAIGPARYL